MTTVERQPPAREAPVLYDEYVKMAHGSGGKAMHALIEGLFLKAFRSPQLDALEDQALLSLQEGAQPAIAFTTDSFVVSPLFFPGGDIGALAINGTVNDLAVSGAEPRWLSASFILEEGFPVAELRSIAESMAGAAAAAGVTIVTGDTKVVNRGKGDGVYINTAGIGIARPGLHISAANARPGDRVIVSGPIGDHGIAIMIARGQIDIDAEIASDSAPLHGLVQAMLAAAPTGVHCLRDATRGGVVTVLNEIARDSGTGVIIQEESVPVRPAVRAACEILGMDALHIANEGKLVAVVDATVADAVLAAMQEHEFGAGAATIGEVVEQPAGRVLLETPYGGARVMDMLVGDPLPRIC